MEIDGREGRLLNIAAATAGGSDARESTDISKNKEYLDTANQDASDVHVGVLKQMKMDVVFVSDTTVSRQDELDVFRISHFSPRTFDEITVILQKRDQNRQLVLDLRKNPGGDLFAAVDIAGLFLPSGSRMLTIEIYKNKTDYIAKGQLWKGNRLAIWQNRFTASASEVLIASLTDNHVGLSFGSNSHGKAMTQTVIGLSDHSALIISRGRLAGPKGNSWQDKGLESVIKRQDAAKSWAQITLRNLN